MSKISHEWWIRRVLLSAGYSDWNVNTATTHFLSLGIPPLISDVAGQRAVRTRYGNGSHRDRGRPRPPARGKDNGKSAVLCDLHLFIGHWALAIGHCFNYQ